MNNITRLTVIALVAIMASLVPGVLQAATPELTVGVVMTDKLPEFDKAHKAFLDTLAKNGYGPDKVQVYVQSPNPDPMSWANSVRKFVSVGVDVIVTYGSPATLTAIREAGDIPVVFSYVYSPGSDITSHKNSTGISSKVPVKTLLLTLRQLKPYKNLAVLYCPGNSDSQDQFDEVSGFSDAMGFKVVKVGVKNAAEVTSKLKGISAKADGIFICSCITVDEGAEALRIAKESGLPTAALLSELAESGAALSLGPSPEEQGVTAARKVAAILGGGSAHDSPMASSKQIDLVLNLQALNSIGMKVPFELINSATKVIK